MRVNFRAAVYAEFPYAIQTCTKLWIFLWSYNGVGAGTDWIPLNLNLYKYIKYSMQNVNPVILNGQGG